MNSVPQLSVAVPVYNEEAVLTELLKRIQETFRDAGVDAYEALFVDDGSTDSTAEMLDAFAAEDSRCVAIHLSRNFGHQAAITAALEHAQGECVVVMDGDLQDAPEVIPRFLEKYRQGYDVVYAIRATRKESVWLRLSYYLYYRLISALSDTRTPPDAGDFALLSRRVVDALKSTTEHNRYLRGLRAWVGFKQIGITVDRDTRFGGQPRYTVTRLFKLALARISNLIQTSRPSGGLERLYS